MKTREIIILFSVGIFSSLTVIVLFLLSEHTVHRNNAFTRRYPHHPITKKYDFSVKFNSYYVSGFKGDHLFLGNKTAPLHLLEINLKTKDTNHIQLTLENNNVTFRSLKVKLKPPYFFIMDGTVPCIYRGRIGDWKASLWMEDYAYFSNAIPIDSNKVYISTTDSESQMTTLGLIQKLENDTASIFLNSDLLEKQFDGVFDVDGLMVSSSKSNSQGYVYYYRNEFMLMDSDLNLIKRQRSIDTIKIAQLQVANIENSNVTKFNAPPTIVNKLAIMHEDLILIKSDRLGKYEDEIMLNEASIVDVYNWQNESYEFSFYFYDIGKEKMREFSMNDTFMIGLIDDKVSVYEINKEQFKTTPRNSDEIN
tara:strand:- start:212 stop:1306 length:1095 start_codon:yes stop_codon:yes gene_type:complete